MQFTQILDAWVHMISGHNSRLIHIRYFVVRVKNVKCLRAMEVTQDLTDIKKIEGKNCLWSGGKIPIVTKQVNGHKYLYFTYWEGGKLVEDYIGPASDKANQIQVIEKRLEWLRRKQSGIQEKIKVLEAELKRLKTQT